MRIYGSSRISGVVFSAKNCNVPKEETGLFGDYYVEEGEQAEADGVKSSSASCVRIWPPTA